MTARMYECVFVSCMRFNDIGIHIVCAHLVHFEIPISCTVLVERLCNVITKSVHSQKKLRFAYLKAKCLQQVSIRFRFC